MMQKLYVSVMMAFVFFPVCVLAEALVLATVANYPPLCVFR
jgi:hypothetical protein